MYQRERSPPVLGSFCLPKPCPTTMNMASPAELDHKLRSIWDCVTCDTIVGADLTLYNAYLFRDLECASLPFRCHSESTLHVPIPKIDAAIRTCEVLNDGPDDGLTGKPCRMGAFGWADFFLGAVNWVRGIMLDASLGHLRGLVCLLGHHQAFG